MLKLTCLLKITTLHNYSNRYYLILDVQNNKNLVKFIYIDCDVIDNQKYNKRRAMISYSLSGS